MSAGSSLRRQLADYVSPLAFRPQKNTRGGFKGPARREKEIVTILGAKRALIANLELAEARRVRMSRLRRVVLIATAIVIALMVFAWATDARAEWPESFRAAARQSCIEQTGDAVFCECAATKLELLLPDPSAEVTEAQFEAALRKAVSLCRTPGAISI